VKLLTSSWWLTAAVLLLILCVSLFALGDYVMGTIFVIVAVFCVVRARKRHLRLKRRR
jgi:hypothetical protein